MKCNHVTHMAGLSEMVSESHPKSVPHPFSSPYITNRGVYVTQNHCKPAGLCDRCSRDVTDMLV